MFGYVTASHRELTGEQKARYGSVYCGICRQIRTRCSQTAGLGLSYDMAFLALLLMSLYEPEETRGKDACLLHPVRRRPWVDNPYIRYAADMNVLLAYFNALDDWEDDGSLAGKFMTEVCGKHRETIARDWPRQYEAVRQCLEELSILEKENCPNPDLPAGVFGKLMGELLVYREDLWAPALRQMGDALGRFVYLMDAAADYRRDRKKGRYNPFAAMDPDRLTPRWREYLVLTMGRCCDYYERLPLVQDKDLLDNILYSGVWVHPVPGQKEGKKHDHRPL